MVFFLSLSIHNRVFVQIQIILLKHRQERRKEKIFIKIFVSELLNKNQKLVFKKLGLSCLVPDSVVVGRQESSISLPDCHSSKVRYNAERQTERHLTIMRKTTSQTCWTAVTVLLSLSLLLSPASGEQKPLSSRTSNISFILLSFLVFLVRSLVDDLLLCY